MGPGTIIPYTIIPKPFFLGARIVPESLGIIVPITGKIRTIFGSFYSDFSDYTQFFWLGIIGVMLYPIFGYNPYFWV